MKSLTKYHDDVYYRGAGFPLMGTLRQAIEFQEDVALVSSSITQILNTTPGERVMEPLFGSYLKDLLWEPNDDFLKPDVEYYVHKAISMWEPRVNISNIEIMASDDDKNQNLLRLRLEFTLKNDPSKIQDVEVTILKGVL